MNSQTFQTDIVIAGAGIAGLSLFLACVKQNRRVILLDKSPLDWLISETEWDARNYAINPNNVKWLESLGLKETLIQRGTPMKAMHVVYEAGSAFFELSAHQIRSDYLAWMIRHDRLHYALKVQALDRPLARDAEQGKLFPQGLWSSVKLQDLSYSEQGITLQAEHRQSKIQIHAKLIVGADGAGSWVRKQAGIKDAIKPYTHHALVGCFQTERPHRGIAYQWFKKNGDIMAWLPMPEGVGVVWSHKPEQQAMERFLHDPQQLADELSLYGNHRLGRWQYQGGIASFPLRMHAAETPYPSSRIVLLGDAKHTVHPLGGQGLNLGLMEARQLAEALYKFPLHDPGHPWLHNTLQRNEPLAQKLMPWGMDLFWQANQPGVMPQPLQKMVGLGWNAMHHSGVLKRIVSKVMLSL